ncbi:MBL fold metallo-hydrolase [Moorellaceae bacterium AZ2]
MLKITTLIDNNKGKHLGLVAEHGLSFFIETDALSPILFDTGQGKNFLYNAALLNVDLSRVETVVLSHGHYDHAGGMRYMLEKGNVRRVYVSRHFFRPQFYKEGFRLEYIGNGLLPSDFEKKGIEIIVVEQSLIEIQPNIFIITNFKSTNDFERVEEPFFYEEGGQWIKDDFRDELALAAISPQGLVIISGCAHVGIINLIKHSIDLLGEKRIHAVIGGTHLVNVCGERLFKTTAALLSLGVRHLGVSHCTGKEAGDYLCKTLGDRVFHNTVGTTAVFE